MTVYIQLCDGAWYQWHDSKKGVKWTRHYRLRLALPVDLARMTVRHLQQLGFTGLKMFNIHGKEVI